ncbi:unnamed protein product, partial [Amoebophrya sp. A25]
DDELDINIVLQPQQVVDEHVFVKPTYHSRSCSSSSIVAEQSASATEKHHQYTPTERTGSFSCASTAYPLSISGRTSTSSVPSTTYTPTARGSSGSY